MQYSKLKLPTRHIISDFSKPRIILVAGCIGNIKSTSIRPRIPPTLCVIPPVDFYSMSWISFIIPIQLYAKTCDGTWNIFEGELDIETRVARDFCNDKLVPIFLPCII